MDKFLNTNFQGENINDKINENNIINIKRMDCFLSIFFMFCEYVEIKTSLIL